MGKFEASNGLDGVVNGGGNGDDGGENIFNILDFPMESLEEGDIGDWDASKSQYLGPIPSELIMMPSTIGAPVSRPPIDANRKPKQVSHRSDDTSRSVILRQNKCSEVGVFQTQSPVSVLETSSAVKIPMIKSNIIGKRARSKRARPTGLSPWLFMSPLSAIKKPNAKKTKERRKNLSRLSNPEKTTLDSSYKCLESHEGAKKCTHCGVAKTPQWREGPTGPKTLCNACGVRYRSGRLFPEYRPAASPTFVPTLHSNSHKKVIEMRNKGKKPFAKTEEPSISSSRVEFVPKSSYLFDPIC